MKTLSIPSSSEILSLDQGLRHFEHIAQRNLQFLPQDILEQLKNRQGTPEELLEAYARLTLDQPLMDVSALVRNQVDSTFPGQVIARTAANPGGIKAGPGLTMVQSALEELRKRNPDSTLDLVQASSGNTALGMALPTALLRSTQEIGDRIRLHIFGHTRMSNERKILLRTLGLTQFIEDADPNDTLADGIPNLNYNHTRAKYFQTTVQDTFYDVDQYAQPHNAEGHVQWTAPFVNKKLEQENKKLTHILAGVGTGGAAVGFQKYYSAQLGSQAPQMIGVDSSEKVFFNKSEEANGRPAQEGIGSLVEGLSGDTSLITRQNVKRILNGGVIPTVDREVFELALALNKEGLPVGPSGAALFSALGKLQGVTKNSVILLLLPDTNALYQSKLGNQDWLDEKLPGLKALPKETFLPFI